MQFWTVPSSPFTYFRDIKLLPPAILDIITVSMLYLKENSKMLLFQTNLDCKQSQYKIVFFQHIFRQPLVKQFQQYVDWILDNTVSNMVQQVIHRQIPIVLILTLLIHRQLVTSFSHSFDHSSLHWLVFLSFSYNGVCFLWINF